MAVKTITIDLEAYERLRRHKRNGQSFSQVIKEHFGARPTGRDLLAALESVRLSDETVEALERLVDRRPQDSTRPIKL